MISKEEISILKSKVSEVNNLLAKYGFKDISICRPLSYEAAEKLNLIGNMVEDGSISLLKLSKIQHEISEILGFEVTFMPENRLNKNDREVVSRNKLLLSEISDIQSFVVTPWLYNKHIVATQNQDEVTKNTTLIKNGEQNKQIVLEALKSNEDVWQILTNSPKIWEEVYKELGYNSNSSLKNGNLA